MTALKTKIPWRSLIGFELCWFLLVFFQQLLFWPVLIYLLYGLWQLPSKNAQIAVLLTAVFGIAVDSIMVATEVLSFAQTAWMPIWFLLLWAIFALALVEVMSKFLTHPGIAFVVAGVGGPLSYIGGAALSDGIMSFPAGVGSYVILGLVWGVLGILFGYSRRWYA